MARATPSLRHRRRTASPASPAREKSERLRSESNRRWRICNHTASVEKPAEDAALASDVHADVHAAPLDADLAAVVEAWPSLLAELRARILAMVAPEAL
jgi:hypothetical protein